MSYKLLMIFTILFILKEQNLGQIITFSKKEVIKHVNTDRELLHDGKYSGKETFKNKLNGNIQKQIARPQKIMI